MQNTIIMVLSMIIGCIAGLTVHSILEDVKKKKLLREKQQKSKSFNFILK